MEEEDDIAEPRTDGAKTFLGRASLTPLSERKVVFISHANPEDNAVTAWYGARIAAAGYDVWTDLIRLLAQTGEYQDLSEMTSLKTFVTSLAGHVAAEAARG